MEEILSTNFSHAVDGSSLALISPLLTRALTGSGELVNSSEAKKRSAQIIGNLGSLVDVKELKLLIKPFLNALLCSIGDPNPGVRLICSKVVGSLSGLLPNDPNIAEFESQCFLLFKGERKISNAGNALFHSGAASCVAELLANKSEISQAAAGVEYILELFQGAKESTSLLVLSAEMISLFAMFLPDAFGSCDKLEEIYESIDLKKTLFPLIMRDMMGGGNVVIENDLCTYHCFSCRPQIGKLVFSC